MKPSVAQASLSPLPPGTPVRLPDGTPATIRAREVCGATYTVDVLGTLHRGWAREQLEVVS